MSERLTDAERETLGNAVGMGLVQANSGNMPGGADTIVAAVEHIVSGRVAAAADLQRERDQLLRWKQEALPLFDGLQDLGRALGLQLGMLVTGPRAVEAATALRAQCDAARDVIDRVRRRHPRGDEESSLLAPGLWCPGCGGERAENGYGACPERAALGAERRAFDG